MHQVIYRAQARKHGEWVTMSGDKLPSIWAYGGLHIGTRELSILYGYDSYNQSKVERIEVHTDTIGRFTGLTDTTKWDELTEEEQKFWLKNHTAEEWTGKFIFEGDIVRGVGLASFRVGVIVWVEKIASFCFRYKWRSDPVNQDWSSASWYLDQCTDTTSVKIIGNIYDNPELLDSHGDK